MERLDLTHSGTFTERAGPLLQAILKSRGDIELGLGLGIIPEKEEIGIMVSLDDDFATVFLIREARALIEIISETDSEEEPYSAVASRVLAHLISSLGDLIEEAETIERDRIIKKAH